MRARAGDPPRTMAQKILAGRCADPMLKASMVEVKVDQIVLTRSPMRAFTEAVQLGLKKATAEVAIAYDTHPITDVGSAKRAEGPHGVPHEMLAHGMVIGRAGIGYAAPVHLERFASPARLCVTDDPRLASLGGVGMLTLVVSPGLLGHALARGTIAMRPPRSIQVSLTGRVRPFICARDVALELVRRGLGEAVRRVEAAHGAPVVLEFAGPSARLLSVSERAVLAGLAPQLGAAGALFVSDERTEVFLRDQRRSKAHRALVPDAGAPCDEVVNVDLGAVDPLLIDAEGAVRSVRDLAGKPVSQVVLGGDTGVTLRDLFAVALLLKSKRVPPRLDFLFSVPSRQMLEVLASSGALTDLIATGARLIEPDQRIVSGGLYPVPADGVSLRTSDPEPRLSAVGPVVASAETLAYAVATGEIGDPRSFKRPVRVTVPRTLPTDDVLVLREKKSSEANSKKAPALAPASTGFSKAATLGVLSAEAALSRLGSGNVAEAFVVATSLDEVRGLAAVGSELGAFVKCIVAPFVPTATVAHLSGCGIGVFSAEDAAVRSLRASASVDVPSPGESKAELTLIASGASVNVKWLAEGVERGWAIAGNSRDAKAKK